MGRVVLRGLRIRLQGKTVFEKPQGTAWHSRCRGFALLLTVCIMFSALASGSTVCSMPTECQPSTVRIRNQLSSLGGFIGGRIGAEPFMLVRAIRNF